MVAVLTQDDIGHSLEATVDDRWTVCVLIVLFFCVHRGGYFLSPLNYYIICGLPDWLWFLWKTVTTKYNSLSAVNGMHDRYWLPPLLPQIKFITGIDQGCSKEVQRSDILKAAEKVKRSTKKGRSVNHFHGSRLWTQRTVMFVNHDGFVSNRFVFEKERYVSNGGDIFPKLLHTIVID